MNLKNEEIYAVFGLEKKYINLIVTLYKESQFYILFNEKIWLQEKKSESLFYKGRVLNNLVKKAEKDLNIKINKVSYNLPIEDIKIEKYEYFYHFSQPKILNTKILQEINDKFLKNYQKKENYQNFLFKVGSYYLVEEKKTFIKPPIGQRINSLKINGYLYRVHWKIIYQYTQILKYASLKPDLCLLLPYAIHMGLLFRKKKDNVLIISVQEQKVLLYLFQNKIFTKYETLKINLQEAITKISKENKCEYLDVKKYLNNLFHLSEKLLINRIDFFNEKENNKIQNLMIASKKIIEKYLQNLLSEVDFVLHEKWKLKKEKTNIYLLGHIEKIGGAFEYFEKIDHYQRLKKSNNLFLGIENDHDLYLVGNAYYHHLQKKIINGIKTRETIPVIK